MQRVHFINHIWISLMCPSLFHSTITHRLLILNHTIVSIKFRPSRRRKIPLTICFYNFQLTTAHLRRPSNWADAIANLGNTMHRVVEPTERSQWHYTDIHKRVSCPEAADLKLSRYSKPIRSYDSTIDHFHPCPFRDDKCSVHVSQSAIPSQCSRYFFVELQTDCVQGTHSQSGNRWDASQSARKSKKVV